jgi:hypothetical protein
MSVCCGDDQIVVIVLQIHQFVRKQASVMIVDQSGCCHNRGFRIANRVGNQPGTN